MNITVSNSSSSLKTQSGSTDAGGARGLCFGPPRRRTLLAPPSCFLRSLSALLIIHHPFLGKTAREWYQICALHPSLCSAAGGHAAPPKAKPSHRRGAGDEGGPRPRFVGGRATRAQVAPQKSAGRHFSALNVMTEQKPLF